MALVVKNLPANAGDIRGIVQSLGQEDPLEEGKVLGTSKHSANAVIMKLMNSSRKYISQMGRIEAK